MFQIARANFRNILFTPDVFQEMLLDKVITYININYECMTYGLLILTEKKMIIFLVKIGFRYVENVTEKLPDTVAGFERPIFFFTK